MSNFIELGKKIYDLNNPREAHRFAVFVARCLLHPQRMNRLKKFFEQSELLKKIAAGYPFVYAGIFLSSFDVRGASAANRRAHAIFIGAV